MAFWGVEVKPGKPYQHRYDEEQGRLRLSQATLGDGSSTKKSILQCNVGDKSPIFLCSLLPNKIETSPLNVEFEEDDEVTFSVIGPSSIHLSGFFYGESENTCGHEDEFGSAGEDIADSDCESDDFDSDSEDEDFEFIDDDMDTLPSSAVRNTGVRIEEIVDDGEAHNEKGSKKVGLIEYNDTNNKNAVKSKTGTLVTESEDEDGFPISTPKTEDKLEKSKNSKKKKAKDDSSLTKNGKRKIDAILQDGDKRDIVQASVSSTPNTEDLNQKKKKGKKDKKAQANEVKKDDIQLEEVKNVENEKKLSTEKNLDKNIDSGADESGSKEKKKKNKNKKKKKQEEKDANTNQSVTNKSVENEKEEEKASQVRTYPNGLIVEELQMGKPDGKRASPGKTVQVRYIGKLKKNGKIFDSNIGKSPFKFPLGVGRVIKGWDVGVNGMRVGDKRRLTIPPAMGYGATGAGGAIPPNAWLVFDVELVNVN